MVQAFEVLNPLKSIGRGVSILLGVDELWSFDREPKITGPERLLKRT